MEGSLEEEKTKGNEKMKQFSKPQMLAMYLLQFHETSEIMNFGVTALLIGIV